MLNYMRKLTFNVDDFLRLYEQGKNDREIADELGCNDSVIYSYRKKHNLPKNFKYKIKLEARLDEILALKKQNKGYRKISKELGVPRATVKYLLDKLGVERAVVRAIQPIQLSDYQKQMLIGTLLGDGSIQERKTATLIFGHCAKQEAYLRYKIEILKELDFWFKGYNIYDKRTNKFYPQFKATSKSNPILLDYWSLLYKDGKKRITDSVLENFTEVSLAFLYMDDGHRNRTIALCDFPDEDLTRFKNFMYDKWKIETSITAQKSIYIKAAFVPKFDGLIRPHVCESMLHKLGDLPWRKGGNKMMA
jgi:hypothetical protein